MDLIVGLVFIMLLIAGLVLAVAFIALPFLVWQIMLTLGTIRDDVKAIKNRTDT